MPTELERAVLQHAIVFGRVVRSKAHKHYRPAIDALERRGLLEQRTGERFIITDAGRAALETED